MGGCLSRVPCPGRTDDRQQIPTNISSVFYPSPSCLVLGSPLPPQESPKRLSFCSHLPLWPSPLPRGHLGVTGKLLLTLQFLDPKLSSSAWTWVPLPDMSLLLSTVHKGPRLLKLLQLLLRLVSSSKCGARQHDLGNLLDLGTS